MNADMDADAHDRIRDELLETANKYIGDGVDPRIVYRIMIEAGHRGLVMTVAFSHAFPDLGGTGHED